MLGDAVLCSAPTSAASIAPFVSVEITLYRGSLTVEILSLWRTVLLLKTNKQNLNQTKSKQKKPKKTIYLYLFFCSLSSIP